MVVAPSAALRWQWALCLWVLSGSAAAGSRGAETPGCGSDELEDVAELTNSAARLGFPARTRTHFVLLMMGPRVGSKMVSSMLRNHGGVHMGGERTEAHLAETYPNVIAERSLRRHYASLEAAKDGAAVGFKTEKYLSWDRDNKSYRLGPFYNGSDLIFKNLGVRVVCLARLNVVARSLSGLTKHTIDADTERSQTTPMDCSRPSRFQTELDRLEAFYEECQILAESTRVLWMPYEQAKDGSPTQEQTLRKLQSFLNLKVKPMAATTTQHAPEPTAKYLRNPRECARQINESHSPQCAAQLNSMLYNPYFPHNRKQALK